MAKVRASLAVVAFCFVGFGIGCGQESTVGPSSGTGGGAGKDSDRTSSASSSVAAAGSGGTVKGGQLASSSESGGRGSDSGGTTTTSLTTSSSIPIGGSGGSSASSVRGGSSSSEAGRTSSSGGADAGAGSSAGSTSILPDGGAVKDASLPDGGASLPKDASTPGGDTAIIPPPPVRPDAGPAFWAAAFASNCKPAAIGGRAQDDGHHKPGTNCMTSGCHLNPKKAEHHAGTDCRGSGCHNNGSPDGSGAPAFLFGGTAYRAATLVPEVGAEIGVKAGSGAYAACSASNGNFWVVAPSGTTSLTWTGATTRLRNANGEAPMMTPPAAGCNASTCHTGTLKITAP